MNPLQNQTLSGSTEHATDVMEAMRIMDVVDALRTEKQSIDAILGDESRKAALQEKIKKTYTHMGIAVQDFDIEQAIQQEAANLWTFKPAKPGLALRIGQLYVDRARIARTVGIPLLSIAAAGGIGYAGVKGARALIEAGAEQSVEASTHAAYQTHVTLTSKLQALRDSPLGSELALEDRQAFTAELTQSDRVLESTGRFFERYPAETLEMQITRENYDKVRQELVPLTQELDQASTYLERAETFVKNHESARETRRGADSLIMQIRNAAPPQALRERAEVTYSNVLVCLQQRQLDEAFSHYRNLGKHQQTISRFVQLKPESEKLYHAVTALAREDLAREQGEVFYRQAQNAIVAGDIDTLAKSIEGLTRISTALSQEYVLIVTGGKARRPDVNPSQENHYLLVEARDNSGKTLEKSILNEETGTVENVRTWGERVSKEVYERVKRDKLDNGIIEDNQFGKKEKGYVSENIYFKDNTNRPIRRGGQITRW